jgi:flagellin FlaB
MGKKMKKIFKNNNLGSMGVGAMIIFIAMVLVAGIAATVFIQVANELQIQALFTGQETIDEVSTGIAIMDIEGHVSNSSKGIDLITITVRGRAGSGDIDLGQLIIEIADTETKAILTYDENNYVENVGDVFNSSAFNLTATTFGIIQLQDADNSTKKDTPIINKGDLVMLTINASEVFDCIPARTDIWGNVVPEIGAWAMISLRTPATYTDVVYDL